MNKTIYDLETFGKEFNFNDPINPIGILNQLIRGVRIKDEQELQAELEEARKKYVYGFKQVEFDKLFGKNVFDLDHGYDGGCYGYLTFKDKVISDYPIRMGNNIQGFLDNLNSEYNKGKRYLKWNKRNQKKQVCYLRFFGL